MRKLIKLLETIPEYCTTDQKSRLKSRRELGMFPIKLLKTIRELNEELFFFALGKKVNFAPNRF